MQTLMLFYSSKSDMGLDIFNYFPNNEMAY